MTKILNLLDYTKYLKNRQGPLTTKAYLGTIKRFLEFINCDPKKLTQAEASKFLSFINSQGVGPRSLNRHASALRSFFKFQTGTELLIDGFSFEKRLPVWLDTPKTKKLVAACKTDFDVTVIKVFWGCGLRVSELANLEVSDIEGRTLKIFGKGAKERMVPIQQSVLDMLEAYIKEHKITGKIFPYSIEFIERRIKATGQKAKLGRVTPHILRHSFSTQYLNKARNDPKALVKLQHILGHESLATTGIYTHCATEELVETMPDIVED